MGNKVVNFCNYFQRFSFSSQLSGVVTKKKSYSHNFSCYALLFKMMTPRQVSMGNKVYKLHLKHETQRETLNLSPDISVGELKAKIKSQFNIPPNQQLILVANGKLISAENHKTVRQAKILSGSKILVSKTCESPKTNPSRTLYTETDRQNENLEKKLVEIGVKSTELETTLGALEDEANKLENAEGENKLKRLKLDAGSLGEQLMQLLQELDQVQLSDQERELRAGRKTAATRLN